MNQMFEDKTLLVTGGSGSFGRQFIRTVLTRYRPKKLIVFSRDEVKQMEMREEFSEELYPCLRYFIGDVRDRNRLYRAMDRVDIVIHAAALKQVPVAEYNPIEAINTNVLGAANLIDAAIDREVDKVVALSSDKAVNPVNLYGASKLCADKLFVAGNNYSGAHGTKFSIVRYGNVLGSRGSVVPLFRKLRPTGVLPITDPRMTRFWITLDQGVDFVISSLDWIKGGEIFVPKIPSMRLVDVARAIAPECKLKIVGIRPGEKLHEVLVPLDEGRRTIEFDDHYTIPPAFPDWEGIGYSSLEGGRPCSDGFQYGSDTNDTWLSADQLRELVSMSLEKEYDGARSDG